MQIKKIIYVILIISLLIGISYGAAAQEVKRAPRINFKGITGEDFIGQAGIFYPFQNNKDALWFTDIRYRMSEDDVEEWNLGLGYRKKIDTAENHIAGIYAFKDRREEYDYYWDMWTLGGEILTDEWDFRLNGYITEDEQVLAPFSTGSTSAYVNNSGKIVISPGKEVYYKSMNGLDIELGKRFTKTETIFNNVGVYAKLFRFFESDTPTLTGRQLRIDKQFGDRNKTTWKIGALWRDDNIRGSETEATFAVSIPFGEGSAGDLADEASPSEIVEARMTEQPERDLDIVVGESVSENTLVNEEEELTAYDSSGNELGRVWYVTAEDNDNIEGTEDKPIDIDYLIDNVLNKIEINNVSTLIKSPQEPVLESNDVIVFLGGDNDFNLGSQYLDLKYGQKLLSTGYGELDVQSDNGEIETTFNPEGERANIIGEGSLVRVNGNNIVSGFKMKNDKDNYKIFSRQYFSGYININHNIFSSNDDFLNQSTDGVTIKAASGAPYIGLESSITEEVKIDIKNNIFDRSNIKTIPSDNENGISITNYSNTNINISGNKIDGFYSGIYISNLYSDNQAEIKDNEINNSIYGIYFENVDDSNGDEKLQTLSEFDKEYEKENNIIGSLQLDVFDHIIKDWYDLNAIRNNSGLTYLMKANLNSASDGYQDLASDTANNGKGWNPIGSDYFYGTFDGNNMVISDLIINRPAEDYVGLFALNYTESVIKNLGLENVNVIGNNKTGGLAGSNGGTIENSYTTGDINGQDYIGGITGNNTGDIINSYSESTVESEGEYVGGLSGNNSKGNISNSYATGKVKGYESVGGLVGYSYMGNINASYATGKVEGSSSVGGLVGYNNTTNITNSHALGNIYSIGNGAGGLVGDNVDGSISKSYAEGNVNSGGYNAGGLVGNNGGIISNSYATGSAHGYDSVGGLVGYNIISGSIEKSYSIGYVTADNLNYLGGLVGYNSGGAVDSASYWDTQTSGQSESDGGIGLNTSLMKDSTNYVDWDFKTIWDIDGTTNDGYPFLK